MMKQKDWIRVKGDLELGNPLSDNLNTHIFFFKLVATYMGLIAESDETKQLFIDSVKCLSMEAVRKPDGRFKSFPEIVQAALYNKPQFELFIQLQRTMTAKAEEKTEEIAAAAQQRPRQREEWAKSYPDKGKGRFRPRRPEPPEFYQDGRPPKQPRDSRVCFRCGKVGHIAANCRAVIPSQRGQKEPPHQPKWPKAAKQRNHDKVCAVTDQEGYFSDEERDE